MSSERACETCKRIVENGELYVYALPGIPISVGNCRKCLRHNAYPLEIAQANTEAIGGLDHANRWWRKSITFKNGKYMTIEKALL